MQLNQLNKAWALAIATALSAGVASAQVVNIPSTYVLPVSAASATQPGFIWRVSEVASGEPNQLSWAEAQLAGTHGANLADPSAVGVADGAAAVSADPYAPIAFNISGIVNVSITDGTSKGVFTPDDQMPGLPGTGGSTDNIAAEALTYLSLPAGVTTFVINSDDGFRLSIGGAAPQDVYGPSTITAGQFDGGRGAADTVCTVNVAKAGLYAARVLYENGGGDGNLEIASLVVSGGQTNRVLVNDVANGGIRAFRAVTTGAAGSYATSLLPTPGEGSASPVPTIAATLLDGPVAVDKTKITLAVDGTVVTPTITKSGKVTTVSYTVPALLPSNTTHTNTLSFVDGTKPVSISWSFTTTGYVPLPPASAVAADTSKPGFKYNVFVNDFYVAAGARNFISDNDNYNNTEINLAGVAVDDTGSVLPNNSSAPSGSLSSVLNLGAGSTGFFPNDIAFPGLSGSTDGVAAEFLTYVQLPAGLSTLGVRTPDVFHAYVGSWDVTQAVLAGRNTSVADSGYQFYVYASTPGFYPVRVALIHANNDLGIELYSVLPNGKKVLVNDVANGGFAAYSATAAPVGPRVSFVNPPTVAHQLIFPSSAVTLHLVDGAVALNDSSVSLSIGGKTVPVTKSRSGNTLSVTWTPTTLITPSEVLPATLTFADANGKVTTESWSFMNLKSLYLPTANPALYDDFESYPEGTTFLPTTPLANVPVAAPASVVGPTGVLGSTWYAWDFTWIEDQTSHGPGDLTDPQSNYYMSWVVVTIDDFASIEGDSKNVQPGQTVNGQPVDQIAFNNVFMAESDNRTGGGGINSDNPLGFNNGQVQFAYSKDYDLSNVTNPVVSWASIYKQNQDNLGAIEYSIDQGATWNPVIYYLDGGKIGSDPTDILFNFDGTVDVAGTFNFVRGEIPIWFDETGTHRGHKYGDGVAAPFTQALSPFFAPRINDDKTEGKRIEAVRIPLAAKQPHVRLRLSQLGTCSWYIGIDNLGFYDVAPFVSPASVITGITSNGTSVTITWTGGGTLEYTSTLSGTYTSTGNSSGTYTAPISGATKFFRVRN